MIGPSNGQRTLIPQGATPAHQRFHKEFFFFFVMIEFLVQAYKIWNMYNQIDQKTIIYVMKFSIYIIIFFCYNRTLLKKTISCIHFPRPINVQHLFFFFFFFGGGGGLTCALYLALNWPVWALILNKVHNSAGLQR